MNGRAGAWEGDVLGKGGGLAWRAGISLVAFLPFCLFEHLHLQTWFSAALMG